MCVRKNYIWKAFIRYSAKTKENSKVLAMIEHLSKITDIPLHGKLRIEIIQVK